MDFGPRAAGIPKIPNLPRFFGNLSPENTIPGPPCPRSTRRAHMVDPAATWRPTDILRGGISAGVTGAPSAPYHPDFRDFGKFREFRDSRKLDSRRFRGAAQNWPDRNRRDSQNRFFTSRSTSGPLGGRSYSLLDPLRPTSPGRIFPGNSGIWVRNSRNKAVLRPV